MAPKNTPRSGKRKTPNVMPPRLLWDRLEAAARIHVSLTTLDKLIRQGELPTVKIGVRRLVPDDALVDFIARRQVSR